MDSRALLIRNEQAKLTATYLNLAGHADVSDLQYASLFIGPVGGLLIGVILYFSVGPGSKGFR